MPSPLMDKRLYLLVFLALFLVFISLILGGFRGKSRTLDFHGTQILPEVAPRAPAPPPTSEMKADSMQDGAQPLSVRELLAGMGRESRHPAAKRFIRDFLGRPELRKILVDSYRRPEPDSARGFFVALGRSPEFKALLIRHGADPEFRRLAVAAASKPRVARLLLENSRRAGQGSVAGLTSAPPTLKDESAWGRAAAEGVLQMIGQQEGGEAPSAGASRVYRQGAGVFAEASIPEMKGTGSKDRMSSIYGRFEPREQEFFIRYGDFFEGCVRGRFLDKCESICCSDAWCRSIASRRFRCQ